MYLLPKKIADFILAVIIIIIVGLMAYSMWYIGALGFFIMTVVATLVLIWLLVSSVNGGGG